MLFVQILVLNSQDIIEKVPLGPHGAQVTVVYPKDTEPFSAKTNANNGQGRGKTTFCVIFCYYKHGHRKTAYYTMHAYLKDLFSENRAISKSCHYLNLRFCTFKTRMYTQYSRYRR